MNIPHQIGAIAETHFNDLQAGMEAGSRMIDQIHHDAAAIRKALLPKHSEQAARVEALMKQVAEVKACVLQQRATMRELRHDVRSLRDHLTNR